MLVQRANLVEDDERVLTEAHIAMLLAGARVMSGGGCPTPRPTAGRAQMPLDSVRVFKHRDMEPVYE